ncbi:MAG: hypothetical protein KKD28_01610 [Chloroflexi bacterium]|nr:hypothetical protein [Chloroflexota bacterium]
MNNTVAAMSAQEFESLVERAIDQRMSVWATQLLDALDRDADGAQVGLQPAFVASLERSMRQAEAGNVTGLSHFRKQLANE